MYKCFVTVLVYILQLSVLYLNMPFLVTFYFDSNHLCIQSVLSTSSTVTAVVVESTKPIVITILTIGCAVEY